MKTSYSQIGQDRWIASLFKESGPGYFLEIGANDGVRDSNTYALERERGWQGICAEPGRRFEALKKNRGCHCDDAVIYDESGKTVEFQVDATLDLMNGVRADLGKHKSRPGKTEVKTTLSLADLLIKWQAPRRIEYLSIDTEGSEYKILAAFPFDRWEIGAITVEHNYEEPKRTELLRLLERHGFTRVRRVLFDDWYLNRARFSPRQIWWQRVVSGAVFARTFARRVKNKLIREAKGLFPFAWGDVPLAAVLARYRPEGALHLGAHTGEEAKLYDRCGVRRVTWVEAIPRLFDQLEANVAPYGHRCIKALVSDVDGEETELHLSSNDLASSSLFHAGADMAKHYPGIEMVDSIWLKTRTVDSLLAEADLAPGDRNLMVLDVQGAELKALRGAARGIARFAYVYAEYSTVPIYKDAATLEDLDECLGGYGFTRVGSLKVLPHGNAVYVRRPGAKRGEL